MATEEKLSEDLVLRSVGYRGYLKTPREFQKMYDFNGETLPNPEVFLREKDDEVRLCFVWSKKDLDRAAKETERLRKAAAKAKEVNA